MRNKATARWCTNAQGSIIIVEYKNNNAIRHFKFKRI